MLVDTHCHLDFPDFDLDRDEILVNMDNHKIGRALIPAIDLVSSKTIISMFSSNSNLFFAVGVHPNEAASWEESTKEEVEKLLGAEKVVAVGEIGLDYYWNKTSESDQIVIFCQQVELASNHGLPIVIHSRDKIGVDAAIQNVYEILVSQQAHSRLSRNSDLTVPGVMHSFSYSLAWAEKFIELGFMIGITGPVTFKNANILQEVVRFCPLESMVIETDSPFLTPEPFRGVRNEPSNVRFVAERISQIKGLPFETIAETTTINARRLFSW